MTFTVQPDTYCGNYYIVHTSTPGAFLEFPVEKIENLDWFICSYREEPFFMRPKAGSLRLQIADQGHLLIYTEKSGFQTICVSPSCEVMIIC